MINHDLWKYSTTKHCNDLLLSFHLFGDCGWTPEKQLRTLYAISNHTERHYDTLVLKKQDGSNRILRTPKPLLKHIQRSITKHILSEIPVSPYAFAYKKETNLLSHALMHTNSPLLLKLDIKDFFDSITFPIIYQYALPETLYPPQIRMLLTHLCCYRERLPQGAPTSPYISNLVMKSFDYHLGGWCADFGITYTRYCDDMIFSGDFDSKMVIKTVKKALFPMGFFLNEAKTQVISQGGRQLVTGVVVNQKPQVSKTYRRQVRKEFYYCQKFGVSSHLLLLGLIEPNDPLAQQKIAGYLQSLSGKITYILQINSNDSYFQQAKKVVRSWLNSIN